jgi:hypothetical protein
MGKFLFDNLEYVVGIAGVLIAGPVLILKLKKPMAKNYGDLTQLVIRHKKMQQAIAPGKKLF